MFADIQSTIDLFSPYVERPMERECVLLDYLLSTDRIQMLQHMQVFQIYV